MVAEFKDILVLSDMQVGSVWGLWPSEYAMTDGTQRSQNKGQQYLWKTWLHLSRWLAEAQKRGDANIVSAVLNGDLIDGKQRLQEALEAMTPNLVDQGRAFRSCLDAFLAPLTPRPTLYSIQGTEFHDQKSGTAVESLAEAIGAIPFESVGIGEYSGELLDLNVDGVVLNFLHGISATAGLYRAVAIDREALWSAIAGKEGKVPKADVIVRCLSEDTELLTRGGWRGPDEVEVGDEVLAFNEATDAVQWEPVQHKKINAYEPVMVRVRGKGYELLVSPDHSMVVARPGGQWRRLRAADLVGKVRQLPMAGLYIPSDPPDLTPEECAVLGLVLADGSVCRTPSRRPYALRIGQRESNTAAIRSRLEGAGFTWSENIRDTMGRSVLDTRTGHLVVTRERTSVFYIPATSAGCLLPWIDADKTLDPQLLEMTHAQFVGLLDGLMTGDGSVNERKLHNTNLRLLEQIQELMVKHGVKSNLRAVQTYRRHDGQERTSYVLHWRPTDRVLFGQGGEWGQATLESYTGRSWCVTVPSGAVVVRRKGGVAITGNSHVHHFVHVEHESKHALITPCWQLQTRFMRRVSAYRMMPDIGAVVIRVWKEATFGGDRVSIYKFLYPLPTRKAVPLTLPADASA